MLTPDQQKNLATIAEASLACEAATRFPAEISAAQAVFESDYLLKYTGNWNCFGIKANGHGCGKKLCPTNEFKAGHLEPETDWFESYSSLADCFTDHARLLISAEVYQNAWCGFMNSGDIDQFVRDFGPIYASAKGYAEMIIGEMHSPHVTEALAAAKRMGVKLHDARTEPQNAGSTQIVLWFHCPGCENDHAFHVPQWTWNGSMETPTFRPSLMCNRDEPLSRCHSFVTDGKIQFLSDCWHKLAGQTVEIPEWEGW